MALTKYKSIRSNYARHCYAGTWQIIQYYPYLHAGTCELSKWHSPLTWQVEIPDTYPIDLRLILILT